MHFKISFKKIYLFILSLFIFSFNSGFIITNQLNLFVIVACPLIFLNILLILFPNNEFKINDFNFTNKLMFFFFLILIVTAFYRGWGFEAFGSEKSGGMVYIKLLLLIGVFITISKYGLNESYIKFLLKIFLISSCLPFISDIFKIVFGYDNYFSKFNSGSTTLEEYWEKYKAGGLLRIQSCSGLSVFVTIYTLMFKNFLNEKGKIIYKKRFILYLLIEIILISLSGHRMTIIENSILFFLYFKFIINYKFNFKYIFKLITLIFILFFIIIIFYEKLPLFIQRVFSFLPFLKSSEIGEDASASNLFRILLWLNAYNLLPQYFWIGKGFAFINNHVSGSNYFEIIEEFTNYGAFHNGPIGLIINLGIGGFIIGITILIKLIKKCIKYFKIEYNSKVYYKIFYLYTIKSIFIFIFLYGDLQTNFQDILLNAILLKIISSNIQKVT